MIFEPSQLRSKFSPIYFQRGLDIFKKNNVLSITVTENKAQKIRLTTRVRGSGNNIYRQYISFRFMQHRLLGVHGDCTCPVGHNCKHVVAACLAYQSKNSSKDSLEELELANWLQKFSRVVETNLLNEKSANWFSLQLFNNYKEAKNHSQPSLYKNELDVIKHGYTPKGKLSKPRLIKTSTFFSSINGFPSNQTKFIGKLLEGCIDDHWYRQNVTFENEIGYSTLLQLIKLGVIYYKKQATALSWLEEAYSLDIEYKKSKKIHQFKLPIPDHHFLVLCEPPIIIDTQTQQAQVVKTSLSGNALELLLEMPDVINNEQLSVLVDLFADENIQRQTKYPNLSSPLPVVEEFKAIIINEDPKPVLQFDDHESMLLVVSFKYGEILAYPNNKDGVSSVKLNNKRYELHHKPLIEKAYLQRIEENLLPLKGYYDVEHDGYYELGRKLSQDEAIEKFAVFQTEVFPILLEEGWLLNFTEDQLLLITQIDQLLVESSPHSDWFELSFNMTLGSEKMTMLPIMRYLLSNYDTVKDLPEKIFVPMLENQVLEFSKPQIAPIFDTFLQLYGQAKDLPDKIQIQPFDAHLIYGLSNQAIEWKGSKESLKLAKKLKEFKGIKKVTPPKGLNATLRNYQQFGLDWLNFLHEFKFNGILADDMGLGKTIQTLTWILKLKETKQLKLPVLLIVPTSLIGNWKAESKIFTPDLTLLTLHGTDRFSLFAEINNYDIVITTYPLIVRDVAVLQEHKFAYLVLDEAQKIKNPKTKLYQSLQTLKSEHRLCLTGTPVENNLGELWSIFNFLMPGFLSNLPRFKKQYQNPIEKEGKSSIQKNLTEKVSPFLLRRTKKEVLTELPDKTVIIKTVEFEPDQANLYETIRLTMESKIRDVVAEKGIGKSQIMILDALLKLRQVCCDPRLVKIDAAKKVKHSAKLELLMDLVTELIEGNHKIILFSQFTSMLSLIEARFTKAKIKYSLLTGQTKKREEAIESFRQGKTSVFLISLKAGGVGLNLTAADTVIHYDPWWNPAVENQATDRAYRIGQNKEVFVYKLIMANTIEEKIIKLQAKKQALQDQIYNKESQQNQQKMTGEDLIDLLAE